MNSFAKIFRGDRGIWVIFMFFCFISLVEVYSASSTLTFRSAYWKPILRHAIFLLFGGGVVLLFHTFKPRYFSALMLALPVTWLLLILVRAFGESVNDSYRFYEIAGISFQPSELAKLCLVVTVAFILSKVQQDKDGKGMRIILILTAITCSLIFLENFSTAALLFVVIFLMMVVGQIPLKRLGILSLILIGAMTIFIAFIMIAPDSIVEKIPRGLTWKSRIENFTSGSNEELNPATYKINDENRQRTHSQLAIAQGGVIGKFPGNSQQRDFLPQAYSDFIYSIIIEEMGIVGALFVLLLYVILFVRAGQIAGRCTKLFPKYLVIGSALIIMTQALSNMAVAVGLIPITGQPLPLISRGGTSILVTCVYIGIILSVSRYENPKGVKAEEIIEMELAEQEQLSEEKSFGEKEETCIS